MDAGPDPVLSAALQAVLFVIFILLYGFFSLAESAFESVNKNRVKALAQEGKPKAIRLNRMMEKPLYRRMVIPFFLILNAFFAASAAVFGYAEYICSVFACWGVVHPRFLSVFVSLLILAFLFVVLGYMIPKRLAELYTEKLAFFCGGPISVLMTLMTPVMWLAEQLKKVMLFLLRQSGKEAEGAFDESEVMSMLEVGKETGVLAEEEKKMIHSIFDFDDKVAHEVMTPRTDVFCIDINDPKEEYFEDMMTLTYTRIPVYEGDNDNIVGILNMKDYFIKAREVGFDNVDIRAILRKPHFIPENKNINDLFRELQSSKQHIAVLVDEYGGFSGIVTMEDLIEEIVGDIDDEYDEEEQAIEAISDMVYRLKGWADLDEVNEALGTDFESEASETIGGYLIDILEEIPEDGDDENLVVPVGRYRFTIETVKDRRIETARLEILPEEDIRADQ